MDSQAKTYQSCRFVEGMLIFHPHKLYHCCIPVNGKFGNYFISEYRGGPLPLDRIRESREHLRSIIANIDKLPDEHCNGCVYISKGPWKSDYMFSELHINHSLLCNLNCRYCLQRGGPIEDKQPQYKLYPALQEIISKKLLDPKAFIFWGGGEPMILDEFEKCFELLMANAGSGELSTNATVFSPSTRDYLAKNPNFILTTSIDCGQPETYFKMKGKDLFHTAWKNLGLYAATGGRVYAKYIVTDYNLDRKELDGFADHVRDLAIKNCCIDLDHIINPSLLQDRHVEAAAYLLGRLRELGASVDVNRHSCGNCPDFGKKVQELAGRAGACA
jgi:organic radical activating enzyme